MKKWNVEICDVTLRDGEQTPGVSFSNEEKCRIANLLDSVGVDVIEAGFPIVSHTEAGCVSAISHMGLDARICCLSRALQSDLDCALQCDVDMVSIFIATSDLHMKIKYRKPRHEVLEQALSMVEYAHDHGIQVRFAAEDASRTDISFLREMYLRGAEYGADYVSFADTVGCLTPLEMASVIDQLVIDLPIPLCVHCHDDMGCAVANTITAAERGAYQLHTTANGIGERAGNASLEEVACALRFKGGIDRYDLSHLLTLSRAVADASGIPVPKTKAIVGEHAFAHESGIHIAALIEDSATYEYIHPALVGGERHYILGKHTGKKAIIHILQSIGHDLSEDRICWILDQVKERGESKCSITHDLLLSLIRQAEAEVKE
ncbi:MAG: homoaconitate hydratase [Methanocalculus sp. MSAO_Arc1]|uniref:homocitrate synthase family protein n=1 Tax=Methanocalculus TaxID=71151 RepID=UPI000FF5079C|nr:MULTISPECIES: homocitrate synthase family protein [unclassified Methanocalculus]MCP1663041.1 methanogen homocitrate synthase [Methanocalculus sp. AMF5]RQD79822.1 MAG: homoaconitate hydratase [Methanocalculus sp. MSAO_Arc1]